MRDRHLPRLCRSCHGPMARQEDTCWRCGAQWAAEEQPRAKLRLAATVLTVPARHDRTVAPRWIAGQALNAASRLSS
jgi:transposase